MDQGEKMQQVAKDFNDIKEKIQEKYDMVMGKISEYKAKLDEISSNVANQSQQWIDKQTQKIKGKIQELTDKIKKWLQDQLDKVQDWMDNIKKEIQEFVTKMAQSLLDALLP